VKPAPERPSLSIVIPAYNEEEGIASIIERTLAARQTIQTRAGMATVEVLVVDDGSTDRTAEIARGFPEVRLLQLARNRGYGAAIKAGFSEATGDLLGFLDADGTCNPDFFADLCLALEAEKADVVVGSRLGSISDMPALRRLGNRLFAGLIEVWSGVPITDSASGMRVLRRTALPRLYPLPDGMDFTPAMSSLAIFDPHLRIVEVPMPYAERTGRSKLRVVRDGLRFLRIIVDTALTYRPLRFLGAAGLLALVLGLGYGIRPVVYYLTAGHLEEDMIYRLVAVAVALTVGVNLLAVGVIGQRTVAVIHEDTEPDRGARRGLNRVLLDFLIPWGVLAVAAGVALNWRSLMEYASTGRISAHWIYVLTGGLLVTLGAEFISFGVLARVVSILRARKAFRRP
jgi:glycosyltransferase involved in cell wall biosynthesis